jgi:hypothetical protein
LKKISEDLHSIIECLAEREQSVDLQAFLKRESVITKNSLGEESAALVTSR